MSSLIPSGSASGTGSMTLAAPVTNSNQTATLPDATGTVMVSGNMPAFSAYPNSAQTFSTGTWTKVLLQNEVFDTNNNFASSRFTPTVAGYYQISGLVYFSGMTGSWATIELYKNGSAYTYGSDLNGTPNGIHLAISNLVYLNGTTDYLELYALQGSGSNQNSGSNFGDTNFSGCLVRAA